MKKLVWILPVLMVMAGCSTLEGTQVAGTATGAVIGAALAPPGMQTTGAVVGATAGLVAGTLLGQTAGGQCLYRRQDGTQYTAAC